MPPASTSSPRSVSDSFPPIVEPAATSTRSSLARRRFGTRAAAVAGDATGHQPSPRVRPTSPESQRRAGRARAPDRPLLLAATVQFANISANSSRSSGVTKCPARFGGRRRIGSFAGYSMGHRRTSNTQRNPYAKYPARRQAGPEDRAISYVQPQRQRRLLV